MTVALKRRLSTLEAAKLANSALELDDLRRLAIALAEAAAEETLRNRAFAERVRVLYGHVPSTSKGSGSAVSLDVELIPIKEIAGRHIDPALPLDPYFLLEAYGPHQLEKALSIFPLYKLKEAAAQVEQRNAGTKPKNRGHKHAIIAYIVETLTLH